MYNIQQMIQSGQNPQQIVTSILQKQQNPMTANLLTLAQQGRVDEIEKIARNLVSAQGKDYDTEFRAFKSQMGFK